jgi:putative ABC transport system permease protein
MQGYPKNPAYAIKLAGQNFTSTISTIEKQWRETYPDNIFSYYFLDEKFDMQYTTVKQIGMIVGVLTFLAVVVSFLGLFGLSLYTVNRKTKEIGIRKVLGASSFSIVSLLSKDYVKLVIIGCAIGLPVGYEMIKKWLQTYAYQMPINASLFLVPVLILVLLTTLTISVKTVKSASTNPIDSLRYE